jgi:type IV pilus assembly protein PilB
MANLDIAERRRPQDGSFRIKLEGREIDFRVSCMTSVFGEKIVLRVLDKGSIASLSLDKLGFHQKGLDEFRKAIASPYGIVLLTGPTGSGKTTTLYTALQEINRPEINIVSVEDPVEYQIQGINQFETKPGIGLDFAKILRSIVRQDPDIIMIGEIRDFETADIAIKAALTGHLVLSTLHTNDAASAITRLYDMGIEPFLISSSTLLCAAQRLIRCLCHNCRKATSLPAEVLKMSQMKLKSDEKPELYHAVGCPACKHTGYSGRMALIETITLDDDIRDMITRKASAQQLKLAAIEKEMKTLRMVGLERVRDGSTTLEEVLRVTASD